MLSLNYFRHQTNITQKSHCLRKVFIYTPDNMLLKLANIRSSWPSSTNHKLQNTKVAHQRPRLYCKHLSQTTPQALFHHTSPCWFSYLRHPDKTHILLYKGQVGWQLNAATAPQCVKNMYYVLESFSLLDSKLQQHTLNLNNMQVTSKDGTINCSSIFAYETQREIKNYIHNNNFSVFVALLEKKTQNRAQQQATKMIP